VSESEAYWGILSIFKIGTLIGLLVLLALSNVTGTKLLSLKSSSAMNGIISLP
jgi:hypothetical protein